MDPHGWDTILLNAHLLFMGIDDFVHLDYINFKIRTFEKHLNHHHICFMIQYVKISLFFLAKKGESRMPYFEYDSDRLMMDASGFT